MQKIAKRETRGPHTEPPTHGPRRMGGLRGYAPYRLRHLATQETYCFSYFSLYFCKLKGFSFYLFCLQIDSLIFYVCELV